MSNLHVGVVFEVCGDVARRIEIFGDAVPSVVEAAGGGCGRDAHSP